jgi:hypothetical protein
MSILTSVPANSQVKIANLPSIEKSAWLTPGQPGTSIEYCIAIVCGSRKSRRLRASATTIADLPSGVKYMLYGSSTMIDLPGLPVFGSIGVRLPSVRPSALLVTHSVRKSHDGTMCCGPMPTLKRPTTFISFGSTT